MRIILTGGKGGSRAPFARLGLGVRGRAGRGPPEALPPGAGLGWQDLPLVPLVLAVTGHLEVTLRRFC